MAERGGGGGECFDFLIWLVGLCCDRRSIVRKRRRLIEGNFVERSVETQSYESSRSSGGSDWQAEPSSCSNNGGTKGYSEREILDQPNVNPLDRTVIPFLTRSASNSLCSLNYRRTVDSENSTPRSYNRKRTAKKDVTRTPNGIIRSFL